MKKKTKKTKDISLLDIVPLELIILDFHAKDKNDALKQIANLFYEKNIVSDRDGFYENLEMRESIGSTACQEGVAFPYTISETNHDVIAGILISREGIDFDDMWGGLTHIFLPKTGREERWKMDHNTYLYYLSRTSSLAKIKNFRDELMKAKSADEVISSIKKGEEELLKRRNKGYVFE